MTSQTFEKTCVTKRSIFRLKQCLAFSIQILLYQSTPPNLHSPNFPLSSSSLPSPPASPPFPQYPHPLVPNTDLSISKTTKRQNLTHLRHLLSPSAWSTAGASAALVRWSGFANCCEHVRLVFGLRGSLWRDRRRAWRGCSFIGRDELIECLTYKLEIQQCFCIARFEDW